MNIKDFKDKHKGGTCVILGNGPSLNEIDMGDLAEYITFGTNRIYKKHIPDYYVCVNDLVIEQFYKEIKKVNAPKFISQRNHFGEDAVYLNTSGSKPTFQTDMAGQMWEGHTVTYVCMQLAHYMGFQDVILLGVDHYYGMEGEPNKEYLMEFADVAHFDSDYFGPGTRWNFPDLARSEVAYSLAHKAFSLRGRNIVNCTARTALRTFPLVPWNVIKNYLMKPKVSAIVSAYYCEKYLDRCIEDLMDQTIPVEIVVVYQEDSPEAKILEKYPDVVGVSTPDIPTIYEAWNLGIKAANGVYITNANTDDQHLPMAFEIMSMVLDANPETDVVYHDSYCTWKDETVDEFLERVDGLYSGRIEGLDSIMQWQDYDGSTLVDGCYIGPQPMWRANLHQRFGLFNPEFESAGDIDFWLRIRGDNNFFHIPEPLGLYFAREDGKELSDPELSIRETMRAHADNMHKGVEIKPYNKQLSMIKLGKEYSLVTTDGLKDLIERNDA